MAITPPRWCRVNACLGCPACRFGPEQKVTLMRQNTESFYGWSVRRAWGRRLVRRFRGLQADLSLGPLVVPAMK